MSPMIAADSSMTTLSVTLRFPLIFPWQITLDERMLPCSVDSAATITSPLTVTSPLKFAASSSKSREEIETLPTRRSDTFPSETISPVISPATSTSPGVVSVPSKMVPSRDLYYLLFPSLSSIILYKAWAEALWATASGKNFPLFHFSHFVGSAPPKFVGRKNRFAYTFACKSQYPTFR